MQLNNLYIAQYLTCSFVAVMLDINRIPAAPQAAAGQETFSPFADFLLALHYCCFLCERQSWLCGQFSSVPETLLQTKRDFSRLTADFVGCKIESLS